MSKAQMIGANLTYIRRYLLMCAYDISVGKDAFDGGQNIPSVGMENNQNQLWNRINRRITMDL